MRRKGLLLAGGSGTRLHPLTRVVNKHLLPVYDKPLVYYSLSTLMLAGIREILVITAPRDRPLFEVLLGDGSHLGLELRYAVQEEPKGLADAYLIGRDFLDGAPSALMLGDNLLYGQGLANLLQRVSAREEGATVFSYLVRDPARYGVVELDAEGTPLGLHEKPEHPPSPYAITGLYFHDERAPELAAELCPSARGELEITDLNRRYLEEGALDVEKLGRGYAWLDAGTPDTLLQAAEFIRNLEERQRLKIACLEEVAYRMGYIDAEQLQGLADGMGGTPYGEYVREIAEFGV